MNDSSNEQSLERLANLIDAASDIMSDENLRKAAASEMSTDVLEAETTTPQASLEELTPETASPDHPSYNQMVLQILANRMVGVVDKQLLRNFNLVALREQLDGHWSTDRARHCVCCRDTRTNAYTHGVFLQTNPTKTPDRISFDEAHSEADLMSRRVWKDFEQLKAIIERHETIIQKRWAKKSTTKRKQVLQSAWTATSDPAPEPMAEMHRPDWYYLRNMCDFKIGCFCGQPIEEKKRHLFFWPRLNLEDLTKFEPLLLLLNARGRHTPSTFAFSDLEPVYFGLRVDRLSHPRFLDMYSMAFTGLETPELYGQLVSWEEDPGAYRRLQIGRDVSPGEGLWILEIQERLYRFLVNICKTILHDQPIADHDRLLSQPVAPEPPLPTANGHEQDIGTSLMITRYESAYHVPAKLDIRRLQTLIESKMAEATDALWALREDPHFFATTLADMYQSRPEQLLDSAGRQHQSVVRPEFKYKFMAYLVGRVWRHHISAVERWGFLCDRVSHLADLKERLFDNAKIPIRPENELPSELAMAIYDLMFHLGSLLEERLKHVVVRAQCSPPLRHLYRRKLRFDSDQCEGQFLDEDVALVCSGVASSPEIDELLWVLGKIQCSNSRSSLGLHNCVEDIERITRRSTGGKIISKMQAVDLSDYTILSECIRQLEMFQPWAATFTACMAEVGVAQKLEAQFKATVSNQEPLFAWKPSESTCAMGVALAKMPYPVNKAPSKGNVDAMRKAESALDAFWVAALLELKDSKLMTERLSEVLLGSTMERTQIWIGPPEAKVEAMQEIHDAIRVCPFDSVPGGAQIPTKVKTLEPRIKVKSRGVARAATTGPATTGPATTGPATTESRQDAQSTISLPIMDVDQRTLKVVEMLFYKSSPGDSPGEIPWVDFTYMMHYVGFGVEKLGGSSWQFTPGSVLTERGYRGIQFHEPHPKAKLAFVVARRYGRRLARTYGWCAEMFRLRTG
ncbi:hypothetical protein N0V82_001483 [Gnomoniopsis sp. IMI 355080]|nr:hypothetical protein N0V82_001483 [Gnomoniopsis sp. IMI 355080]